MSSGTTDAGYEMVRSLQAREWFAQKDSVALPLTARGWSGGTYWMNGPNILYLTFGQIKYGKYGEGEASRPR